MSYMSSEAQRLDRLYSPEQRPRPNFGVTKGQGLDIEARRGVSPKFWQAIKLAFVFLAFASCIAASVISLSASTVSLMKDCNSLTATIADAEAERSNLLIVRSSLMSSSRIDRIATQNLNMVYPESSETIQLSDASSVNLSAQSN